MNSIPTVHVWHDPPPMEAGAPLPVLYASESSLVVAYHVADQSGDSERVAVLHFDATCHKFGAPNDEVLSGHPLYPFGLTFYEFHWVEKSPWIASLCKQNSVHHRHCDSAFESLSHWIITFHDSTLEVVGRAASVLGIYDSLTPEQALVRAISRSVDAF